MANVITAAQADKIMRENGGYLTTIGWGYTLHSDVEPVVEGGWKTTWARTGGMGNHGDLYLIPGDKRTRAIHREVKVAEFVQAGLSLKQAERLYELKVPYKHELLCILAEILENKEMVSVCFRYTGYGWGSGRADWHRDWVAPIFGTNHPIFMLSAPRESALMEMVDHLAM